jgi:hypothetical protein
LLWHPSFRYYKREAAKLVKLVEEYSHPNIAGAIGLHGESMVLEGFARHEFVMKGRNTQSYGGKDWTKSGHNLDFIFVRDDIAYGVEVKNTLGYMEQEELRIKIEMCRWLDIKSRFIRFKSLTPSHVPPMPRIFHPRFSRHVAPLYSGSSH